MKGKLADKARLYHILDAIFEIERYIENTDFTGFQKNTMMQFASIKQLEIIGEASARLTKDLKEEHSEIKWREIIGFRNILVHEYFGVDLFIVWSIIKNEIPKLKEQISFILKKSLNKS